MQFNRVSQAANGNVVTSVFEASFANEAERLDFENKIKNKIKRMRIHRDLVDDNFRDLLSPATSAKFIETVNKKANIAGTPVESSIISFDVRRSRVTEFMSHVLLEENYGCVFHEVADKRTNLEFHKADRHVEGIDVTGVQSTEDGMRFVVCEVKATEIENVSPSAVVKGLIADIDKAYGDEKNRLTREIADMISKLGEANITSNEIRNIIQFLVTALADKDSKQEYIKRVVFYPFLIKQHKSAASLSAGVEFEQFKDKDYAEAELQGVIWSFNEDLNTFCRKIYDEALK